MGYPCLYTQVCKSRSPLSAAKGTVDFNIEGLRVNSGTSGVRAQHGEGGLTQACHPLGQLALPPRALRVHISEMGKPPSHWMGVNIT